MPATKPNWKTIRITIDYGYHGSHPAVEIVCYAAGRLHFKNLRNGSGLRPYQSISDKEHRLSEAEILRLNDCISELLQCEQGHNNELVMDGGSFSCSLLLRDGQRAEWSHYGGFSSARLEKLEEELCQLLGVEFFLEKHAGQWYRLPEEA